MEELFQRFSHLAEGIYNSLDNQSLTNCRCRLLLRRLEEKNTTDDINVMGWKGFTDKNPKTDDFVQLLRDAAEKGNIQIFKVLIHTLEDRNPVVAVDDIIGQATSPTPSITDL